MAEANALFLFIPEAQRVFLVDGLRPATAEGRAYAGDPFPEVRLFRIDDQGGWPSVDQRLRFLGTPLCTPRCGCSNVPLTGQPLGGEGRLPPCRCQADSLE